MIFNYIKNLWNGNVKLYIVFWIYFTLVEIIFDQLFIEKVYDTNIYFLIFIFYIIYRFFIYKSIWSAANNYNGKFIWKILSKVIVVLDLIFLILFLSPKLFA